MGRYDVAQICENGHLITDAASHTELQEAFCTKCGKRAIMACEKCGAPIRGDYVAEGVIRFSSHYEVPAYCHSCGVPYPWTSARIGAATDLVEEAEGLSSEDKEAFRTALPDIASETPRTELAAGRIKKLLSKVGGKVGGAILDVAVKVAVEAAKKVLLQ